MNILTCIQFGQNLKFGFANLGCRNKQTSRNRSETCRISFEFMRPAVAGFVNTHYNQTLSIFGEPSDTIWAVGSIASATPMCVAACTWR